MKKRVVIVVNTAWNVYNFRLGLIKSLQKSGYEVSVIAPKDMYVEKLLEYKIKHYNVEMDNKGSNVLKDIGLILQYYKILKTIKPDIILSYTIKPNIYTSFVSKILDIPVVCNVSGLGSAFVSQTFVSHIVKFLYKVAFLFANRVFFQNISDQQFFISHKLVDKNVSQLIAGSGIDTALYQPTSIKQSLKPKFIMVARLIKDKGVLEYIEAAKVIKSKYKDIEFALLGDFYFDNPTSITHQEVQKWCDDGIIEYLGVSDNVKDIVQEYDCVVLPSYREGLSRVLLEAASMSKPIVTTDIAGCKEVVEDGVNGFLCKVKDVESLVEALEKMIKLSTTQREEMGLKGREKVIKEFSEDLVIDAYFEVISELLDG